MIPEVRTEDRVDHGIKRGVEAAEPPEERDQTGIYGQIFPQSHHQGQDEEGQPADDERS